MSAFVPDASVAVKWLLQEPETPAALVLLRRGGRIRAPALLRVEAAAAIVRRYRLGAISADDARERLDHCAKLLSDRRVNYVPDKALIAAAAEIALRIKHNLQDCLYIACAARDGVEMFTADVRLLERAAAHFPFVRAL